MIEEKLLCIKSVSKKFKEHMVLDKVNLSVGKGQVIGIVGTNGSGKTTLLKVIMGLVYPDEDDVSIDKDKILPGLLGRLPTRLEH